MTLFGNAAELFLSREREILCEGPARCGKSNAVLTKAKYLAESHPGARLLFLRKTRASLSHSILADFEGKILGPSHPAVGRARRDHRSAYYFPNGSTIVLGGMDQPDRFLSAEYDLFAYFQCEEETDESAWDTLMSRLSGRTLGFQQAIADCNPASERHWLLRRAQSRLCLSCARTVERDAVACANCKGTSIGGMQHLAFKHWENPLLFDHDRREWTEFGREYLTNTLGRLRGLRRKRLLLGQWVSEEGQILEDFDPSVHVLSGEAKKTPGQGWQLHVKHDAWSADSKDPMRRTPVPIDWFGAGYDWGYSPDPGVFEVWAYDRYGRRFLVYECGRLKWQVDQWADLAERLWKEFQFRYIACDPSFNAIIDAFNRRLTPFAGRDAPAIAIGADNRLRSKKDDMTLAGIDLMRWALRDHKGEVRTFLMRDAARDGVDSTLREEGRPCSSEEEIPSWVFATKKTTGEMIEKPSDDCDDHFMAAWRYEVGEGYGKRLGEKLGAVQPYPEKSLGAVLNHAKKMAAAKKRD